MWIENDEMLGLVPQIEIGSSHYPTECPICGENDCHILMHRQNANSTRGTLWIWCDSCNNYNHVAYRIPDWWSNPDFIDDERLDSTADYPSTIERKIDAWINKLICS